MVSLLTSFSNTGTANNTTLTLTTNAVIPVGAVVVIGCNRSVTTTDPNGVNSISGTGSNSWSLVASAGRAGTHDMSIYICKVIQEIASGTIITITWNIASTRKAAQAAVFSGLIGTFEARNSTTVGATNTNFGGNGSSSTSQSVTTTTSVTNPRSLVVGIHSLASTQTITTANGTKIGDVRTSVGSSDRGLAMTWLETNSAGTRTSTATSSIAAGWSAAIVTLPAEEPIISTVPGNVIIGGTKKTVSGMYVIIGGVKKPVASISTVVGGTKKTVAS